MSSNIELQDKSNNEKDLNEESNSDCLGPNVITLPRTKRWVLFFILILLNILMSIDHGTIPAATAQIRLDLGINDTILGVFGSLVYAGSILGSLISLSVINLFNRKYLMMISITACGLCLFLFTIKQHFSLLFINRTLAFIAIYLPVWCDQLGIESQKTMMIAMVQLCSILGVVLGYSLTTLFTDAYGWKISFIVEAISIILLSMTLAFFSNDYFKATLRRNYKLSNRKNSYFYDETLDQSSIQSQIKEDKGIMKIIRQFTTILKEPIYIFSVATFASLLFIVTCVQYWAADYMMSTLNISDENTRLLSFALVCLTSPTVGVILGGIVVSCFGGYESKHSILFCLFFALLAFIFTIPAPLVNTLPLFTIVLWLVLFFGGAIIAPINGIIISSVSKEYAGSANSISHLFCNLIGKLPAPYVYGAIKTYFSGRVAMMASMWISVLSVGFLLVATVMRYRHYDRIQRFDIDSDIFIRDLNGDVNKKTCDRSQNVKA